MKKYCPYILRQKGQIRNKCPYWIFQEMTCHGLTDMCKYFDFLKIQMSTSLNSIPQLFENEMSRTLFVGQIQGPRIHKSSLWY